MLNSFLVAVIYKRAHRATVAFLEVLAASVVYESGLLRRREADFIL